VALLGSTSGDHGAFHPAILPYRPECIGRRPRELVDPKIEEHRGRVVKNTGDGLLAEFPSVVAAVRCAVEVQRGMAEANAAVSPDKRIEFRVGINLGDVIPRMRSCTRFSAAARGVDFMSPKEIICLVPPRTSGYGNYAARETKWQSYEKVGDRRAAAVTSGPVPPG